MLKYMFTVKRNPKLSEKQTERHYRTIHTNLVRKAFGIVPSFRKYVQNKVIASFVYDHNQWGKTREVPPQFDRCVELYFENAEEAMKAFQSPEMMACMEDAPNFIDATIPESIKVYEIEEVVALKREEYTGQLCKGFTPADEKNF